MVYYETGIERPEILGSGSQFSSVITTPDEKEARAAFATGSRNYLIRVTITNGKRTIDEWDAELKEWARH